MKRSIFILLLLLALLLSLAMVYAPVKVMPGRTTIYLQCRGDEFLITQYSDTSIKVTCWRWED